MSTLAAVGRPVHWPPMTPSVAPADDGPQRVPANPCACPLLQALYRMKLTDESRILYEVLPARSKEGAWMDHILLWAVEKDHDR